jgi:acetyl/propionyl-CoA carboxylase alpha subunit
MPQIEKLLIANRGEIAMRVLRTATAMNIPCATVFTEHDSDMPHALHDEAINISDYLSVDEILAAAKSSGANAIHPGYGFLAENPEFVRTVEKAGMIFIGPTADAMDAVGDKSRARALATSLDIPVAEGVGPFSDPKEIAEAARNLGAPVMLKASAGGGGKGMKRLFDFEDLVAIIATSQRETKAAFGDDRMIVERYINPARHIEVQVFGDGKRCIALGERECSLQRRHQKILEESPSTAIDAELRKRLFDAARTLCEAVGYRNAGTVEFLLSPNLEFYFLEVNARLQVEHPVTEMCTGMDLVALQLAVAQGEDLPEQEEVYAAGHAIEVRLNAEDPWNDYLPSAGRLLRVDWPQNELVRIDTGMGSSVGTQYDSLIAKLIAWGETRDEAITTLKHALQETHMLGLYTNQPLALKALDEPWFRAGETYIDTVDKWDIGKRPVPDSFAPAAAAVFAGPTPAPPGAWAELGAWRLT